MRVEDKIHLLTDITLFLTSIRDADKQFKKFQDKITNMESTAQQLKAYVEDIDIAEETLREVIVKIKRESGRDQYMHTPEELLNNIQKLADAALR